MITFQEFLIEKTAFYQEVLDKLTPSEQMEFVEYLKHADASNIMKMIRSVHKPSHSLKGKKHP